MSDIKLSLATGAPLTEQTFSDFVERLRHDCIGDAVNLHHTAYPVFLVQNKIRAHVPDFTSHQKCIFDGEACSTFDTIKEFWGNLEQEEQQGIDLLAIEQGGCSFLDLEDDDQWDLIASGDASDIIESVEVRYYEEEWQTVSQYFTRDAAEAFIKRWGHDCGELNIYVGSSYWCPEYNAIRQALMDGRLVLASS